MSKLLKKHLSEPWFSLVMLGKKKYEGRLNKGDFSMLNIGDVITFFNDDFGIHREFSVQVTKIRKYESFLLFLTSKLRKTLPSISTIEQGITVYRNYYTPKDEADYGIIAIKMKTIEL